MTSRPWMAALAVCALLLGLGLGYLVGVEAGARRTAQVPVPAAVPGNRPPAGAPDAALVDSLRREIAELKAREVRQRMDALGARRPRRPGGTDGAAGPGEGPEPAVAGTPKRPDSPADLLAALRAALVARDGPALAWLRALLDEQIASGRIPATTVIDWLRSEADPEVLTQLADALGRNLSGELDGPVLAGLLTAAQQGAGEANRLAALQVLNAAGAAPRDALDGIRAIAEGDPSADLRLEAMVMLTRYLGDPASAEHKAVAEMLLRTARHDANPRLRAEAVMSLNLSELGGSDGQTLLEVLRTDADEDVRATVAGILPHASGVAAETRLSGMEGQYAKETSPMVRRMLLGSIVQLGGARAQPILTRLKGVDPTFARDIDEYLGILESGVTDGMEIEMKKAALSDGAALPGSDR